MNNVLFTILYKVPILFANPPMDDGGGTDPPVYNALSTIITNVGTLLTAVLGWLTDMAEWILAEPLALLGFSVAFLMLGVKVLHSLIKFSW